MRPLKLISAGSDQISSYYLADYIRAEVEKDLAANYPMVAPAYAERRSALAKSMGLGRKAGETVKAGRRAKVKA